MSDWDWDFIVRDTNGDYAAIGKRVERKISQLTEENASQKHCYVQLEAERQRLCDENARLTKQFQVLCVDSALAEKTLREENTQLKSDRSAFAEETQKYRDAWMADQKEIAKLKELHRVEFEECAKLDGVIERMQAVVDAARAAIHIMANKGTRAATLCLRKALKALDDGSAG